MKKLSSFELGHSIIHYRERVVELLNGEGELISIDIDDEKLINILIANIKKEKVNAGIWDLVKGLGMLSGCPHCEPREL